MADNQQKTGVNAVEMPLTWDKDLDKRGVSLLKLNTDNVPPGRAYYKLIYGKYFNEEESNGRHHIFVDVLDENMNREYGTQVRFFWGDEGEEIKTIDKNKNENYGTDFPMFAAGNGYDMNVNEPYTDEVIGMGLGDIGSEEIGIHVSYGFVFQKLFKGETGEEKEKEEEFEEFSKEKILEWAVNNMKSLTRLTQDIELTKNGLSELLLRVDSIENNILLQQSELGNLIKKLDEE